MSMTERNPTKVAACGCPYDPEYDEGSLGWHLTENHLHDRIDSIRMDLKGMTHNLEALGEGCD